MNVALLRSQFATQGIAVAAPFFTSTFARSLYRDARQLTVRGEWEKAVRRPQRTARHVVDPMSSEGRRKYFGYSFSQFAIGASGENQWTLDDQGHEGARTGGRLHALRSLAKFVADGRFSMFFARVSGADPSSLRSSAALSAFFGGDFLSLHTDGAGRCGAFSIQLTPFWLPHWGGQLMFLEDVEQRVAQAVLPTFNAAIFFRTPRPHLVSAVADGAPVPRYACSGFFWQEGAESGR